MNRSQLLIDPRLFRSSHALDYHNSWGKLGRPLLAIPVCMGQGYLWVLNKGVVQALLAQDSAGAQTQTFWSGYLPGGLRHQGVGAKNFGMSPGAHRTHTLLAYWGRLILARGPSQLWKKTLRDFGLKFWPPTNFSKDWFSYDLGHESNFESCSENGLLTPTAWTEHRSRTQTSGWIFHESPPDVPQKIPGGVGCPEVLEQVCPQKKRVLRGAPEPSQQPAGPTPPAPTLDSDLIFTWFRPDSGPKRGISGPNQVQIRSKSGPKQKRCGKRCLERVGGRGIGPVEMTL